MLGWHDGAGGRVVDDVGKPRIEVVAAHLVNLAWNGLSQLDVSPGLATIQADNAPAGP